MTLDELQFAGNAVSTVAILISLVYLALQIRQAEKNQRALIQQGRATRISAAAQALANPATAEAIHRCWDGARDISTVQLFQFSFVCRQMFIGAEDSFLQHQNSLLGEVAHASFIASMKAYLAAPGIRAMWNLTRDWYEPEFCEFIDRLLIEVKPARFDRLAEWQAAVVGTIARGAQHPGGAGLIVRAVSTT